MLIVEKLNDEYFTVSCKYSQDYIKRFNEIPGHFFDKELSLNIIPTIEFYLFEFLFLGEIVYKTPRWILANEDMPDYTKTYLLKNKDLKLPKLKYEPYKYQDYGAKYMIEKINEFGFIINADSVGLGKTMQAILTMLYYIENKKAENVLLLCKKALKFQWKNEIEKFSNYDINKITILDGTTNKKVKQAKEFKEMSNGKILISNYEVTQAKCFEELKDIKIDVLIIDEAHLIANNGVKNKEITKLSKKIKYKIFLTGTPIMSKPDNLFYLSRIGDKKYFGKWIEFKKHHIREVSKSFGMDTVGYTNLDELQEKAQNIIIRRTENEVSIDLPKMLPPNKVICELDSTQIKILKAIETEKSKINAEIINIKENPSKSIDSLEKLEKLEASSKGLIASFQAVANDPRLFLLSKSEHIRRKFSKYIPKNYEMSNKTSALLDILEEIVDSNQKAIIFTKYERCAQMLKEDIEKAFKDRDNFNPVLFTGAINSEQRQENVKIFTNSPLHNVFIATDAGAEGLNLQVANHVIHYDVANTNAIKVQRNGRARRVGSKYERVYVYDLLTKNTVDISKDETLLKQEALSHSLTGIDEARSKAIKEAMKG